MTPFQRFLLLVDVPPRFGPCDVCKRTRLYWLWHVNRRILCSGCASVDDLGHSIAAATAYPGTPCKLCDRPFAAGQHARDLPVQWVDVPGIAHLACLHQVFGDPYLDAAVIALAA